ncbi:allantoate amidohydrolase [Chitinophaga agrisoli]|uniref:Allantoate amidohydrolase n=1 Tax=Chitinophaga agrisoli TaxID=2607653 RepID=A0A5B2VRC9_9BACT|nr:allantoate amidohydrolase [Chitinophaga agrisoli]KAA2241364.1 allantoate amidohydrolase [Chitinophaga agrisoli]
MQTYLQRAQKIMDRIQELAAISQTEQGLTRTFGSPAWREAALTIQGWMQEAGLHTWIDNIGNVRARLNSPAPGARTFVIASHMDTVVNAGRFDGPLGIIMGLDLVAQFTHTHTPLPFHIELIAFSDEEGCRFHTTFLGSKVVAGGFEPGLLLQKDAAGITLMQAIHTNGGNETGLPADAILPEDWLGYFEIHIEQGPVLYKRNIPVAVVKAIAGQQRIAITFRGMAGHAGTVPMDMRRDALGCAAEFTLAVEKIALANKDRIMATVGKLDVVNAASNVIPGEVSCTLDLRSADENELTALAASLQRSLAEICQQRHIDYEWTPVQETRPVLTDGFLNTLLEQSITTAGYEALQLVSGAGHDAVAIAAVAPVCMLFVRCFDGISHHPQENVELADITAAVEVAGNFMQQVITHINQHVLWKSPH